MNRLTDYKTSPPKETNFQHFEKEIREIGLQNLAVKKGTPIHCEDIGCRECDFHMKAGECGHQLADWLYAEYKEDTRTTTQEHCFLLAIERGFIVRDNHNNLYWYENSPSKIDGVWEDNGGDVVKLNFITNLQFPFIKDEMWSVERLIELEVKEC
jgi:hypothetical protein